MLNECSKKKRFDLKVVHIFVSRLLSCVAAEAAE